MPSQTKRKARIQFTTCTDDHASPQLNRRNSRRPRFPRFLHGCSYHSCELHHSLLSCGICFLFLCIAAITFFVTQSDLTVQGTSWLWGKRGRECKKDKDCATRLRKDYDSLSWGQCLLPPNGTATCKEHKCVDPPPRPVTMPIDCDDGHWCTVNDKCIPSKGECAGVTRGCHDVDFCTLETCSEDLKTCVAVDAEDSDVCENTCTTDDDCRAEYYCANGRCANFRDLNESLFFSAYEIVPCADDPDDYSMLQHYIIYEEGYSPATDEDYDNHGMRYRTLDSAKGVFFPEDAQDSFNIPMESAAGVQTKIIPPTDTTPAYSEITLTLRTECQSLPDASTCLTKWMRRRYDFELELEDCMVDPDDPLGPVFGTKVGPCHDLKIRRAYSMSLDLVDCPFFTHRTLIKPLSRMRLQLPGKTEQANVVLAGDWIQAVVEMDAEQLQNNPVMKNQSPFLTEAYVCTVDPTHRLAGCAIGTQKNNCPFRGCVGWSGVFNAESPLTSIREYMVDSQRLSAAIQDGVNFCRGVGYATTGCTPGTCSWGVNSLQPPFGSADGFAFRAQGTAGEIIVVDASYRMQYCGEPNNSTGSTGSAGRRLSSLTYRKSTAFKLGEATEVSEKEP